MGPKSKKAQSPGIENLEMTASAVYPRGSSRTVPMNRRRSPSQPPARASGTDDSTPGPPPVDNDLERAFFQDGLSEDHITAASEREQDREAIHRAVHGRGNRWVYGVAAVAACVAGAFVLAPGLLGRRRIAARPTLSALSAPQAPAAPAPPAPPPPPEPATAAAELEAAAPPTAAAHPTVGVAQLRAGSAAAAPPAGAASAATLPGDVMAEAAEAPQDAKATCERLLQRGKFLELKTACTRAFEAAPDAGLAVQVARSALERERYVDAQSWARRAIQLDNQHGEAFLTLGGAEQGLGHAALARTAYTRYLQLEPNGAYADDVRALINQL
jgi:hypothetical protein